MSRSAWDAYRLRLKRKRLLLRAWRKSKELRKDVDRTGQITPSDFLCFATVRNEALRLPFFLEHYRRLGVRHFLIVDNDSDDGTTALLRAASDVSLWQTGASYKSARFGMDWLTALQFRYGHGHWCLTVDADEALIYPNWEDRPLADLTAWLDARGMRAFGAMMLDLYPQGFLTQQSYHAGQNPTEVLGWFDAEGYRKQPNPRFGSEWVQGGVRDRVFFQDRPERAPTLNKVPLVRWDRSYAYVTSTHHMLPRHLNRVFATQDAGRMSGVLLHSKFLPSISEKSAEELNRRQHFENASQYETYYRRLVDDLSLWSEKSVRYQGWQQLVDLGLMDAQEW